ncbi:MAG: hypothetical protein K9J30_04725 [Bacteroidales bacterium]|nr:hypothetical protein [Bacteroidales bacterium]
MQKLSLQPHSHGPVGTFMMFIFGIWMTTCVCGQDKQPFSDFDDNNAIVEVLLAHDVNLINGILYNYFYPHVNGSPYLFDDLQTGTVVLNGQIYRNQSLRFDVFNNQLILTHPVDKQHGRSIIMVREWIDYFSINHMLFKSIGFDDGISRYVQVIYEEKNLSCYFHWQKEMKLENTSQLRDYYFTDPSRVIIVKKGSKHYSITTKRSFIKIFEKKYRSELRKIIKSEKIKFRKASECQMTDFLEVCNPLVNNEFHIVE